MSSWYFHGDFADEHPELADTCLENTPTGVETTALVLVKRPVMVIARPHPLSMEKVSATIPAGLSVAEIVGHNAKNCRVEIGGMVIPEEWWPRIRPKPGTIVQVTRFPQGGGGGGWKMVFRLVAFAAIAVLTYGIAAGVAWMPEMIQGLSAGWAAVTAAGFGLGTSLLVNALCPPASTGVGQQTTPTQLKGITGAQNAADLYGAVTCVFGTMLVYPKLAAAYYTELSGDNQYLRCLFDLGYGNLQYAALQIGTDDLDNLTDVDYEIGPAPTLFSQDIEELAAADVLNTDGNLAVHTSGANADEGAIDLTWPAGLFALNSKGTAIAATCIVEVQYQAVGDGNLGATGPVSAIPLVSQGSYSEHITATVTITGDGNGAAAAAVVASIGTVNGNTLYGVTAINVTAGGSGYSYADATLNISGATAGDTAAVIGNPEISLSGGTWHNALTASGLTISNASARVSNGNLIVTSSAQQSLRVGIRFKYPSKGEYNLQVKRVSTDYQSAPANQQSGDLTWTVIRTIRYSTPSSTPTTKVGMRIKATDQLNGTVNQFNLLLSQVIPVWNGNNWIDEQSSNPAWIYRWLLRDCPANPRHVDESRIDDEALKEWGAECDEKGFSFNYTNDQVTTVFALLQIICACGRASFTVVDGKYSVVRDIPQTVPVQIFTPRNTASFEGSRAFVDVVHALRVQFINPEAGYQQDEVVVYDDRYDETNATKFEQLQIPGCADAEMAWKLGRYHLAVGRLRPNTYSWTTDVEHLICNRGDLVYFASDVISVGIGWGRVSATTLDGNGNIVSVMVDEPQTVIDTSKTYAMRFRCKDGTAKVSVVTFTAGAVIKQFNLTTPMPGINPGDLFLVGIQGQDSIPLLVSKIEPTTDLAAKITAVDASPAALDADAGYIDSGGTYHAGLPTITSSITGQAWLDAPPAPQMVLCSSSQILSNQSDQGGTSPVMLVSLG